MHKLFTLLACLLFLQSSFALLNQCSFSGSDSKTAQTEHDCCPDTGLDLNGDVSDCDCPDLVPGHVPMNQHQVLLAELRDIAIPETLPALASLFKRRLRPPIIIA